MNAGEREIMAAKGGLQIVKELGLPKKKKIWRQGSLLVVMGAFTKAKAKL